MSAVCRVRHTTLHLIFISYIYLPKTAVPHSLILFLEAFVCEGEKKRKKKKKKKRKEKEKKIKREASRVCEIDRNDMTFRHQSVAGISLVWLCRCAAETSSHQ